MSQQWTTNTPQVIGESTLQIRGIRDSSVGSITQAKNLRYDNGREVETFRMKWPLM